MSLFFFSIFFSILAIFAFLPSESRVLCFSSFALILVSFLAIFLATLHSGAFFSLLALASFLAIFFCALASFFSALFAFLAAFFSSLLDGGMFSRSSPCEAPC